MLFNEFEFVDYRKYFCEFIRSDLLQILEVILVDFSVVKVRVLIVADGLCFQKFKDESAMVGIT